MPVFKTLREREREREREVADLCLFSRLGERERERERGFIMFAKFALVMIWFGWVACIIPFIYAFPPKINHC